MSALNKEARGRHKDALAKIQALLEAQGFDDNTPIGKVSGSFKGEHSHPFEAMGFVFGGRFIVKTGGKTYDCSPDPVTGISKPFHVPAMQLHSEQTGPDGALVVVGRRWPKGELEAITNSEMKNLPKKAEEIIGGGPKL